MKVNPATQINKGQVRLNYTERLNYLPILFKKIISVILQSPSDRLRVPEPVGGAANSD
jgi:hypothetical protein